LYLQYLQEYNTSTGINFGKIIKSIRVVKDLASEVLNQRGYPLASSSVNPRGILLTPNENEVDRRPSVVLSSGGIKDIATLRYVLAHEIGHAVDMFLASTPVPVSLQKNLVVLLVNLFHNI
jgi:Zn-dependent protease with chaperone function